MSKKDDQMRAQAQLELLAKNRRYLDEHLKAGDVLTHTRCMGCLEEHVFTGRDGIWLCGTPTADTRKLSGLKGSAQANAVNDISPLNVTHVNRVPLENLSFLARCQAQQKA
jgi:hypothetical protein